MGNTDSDPANKDNAAPGRDESREEPDSTWGVGSASALESMKQREARRSKSAPKPDGEGRPSAE